MRTLAALCSLLVVPVLGSWTAPAAGPVQFRPHDIDANFRGGYAVSVADFNQDGRADVIANSLQVNDVAWYENPGPSGGPWPRHVIVPGMQSIVNQAPEDIDGDGIPELALQSEFAMQAAKSAGHNWIARSQGDPRKPWKAEKIDAFPTSHHVVWADLDGDGRKELLNAPLLGERSLSPTYDQDTASMFWYDQKTWTRHLVASGIPGIIHRVRPVHWDGDRREDLLVASFEGITLYQSSGSGDTLSFGKTVLSAGHREKAPRLGASDVGAGMQDGRRFFASIEPWHGNEVVVYNEVGGRWQRRVIFDKVTSGHEIAVADLNGDGRADVIANDNSRVTEQRPTASPGVHVFYAPDDPAGGEWQYQRLEDRSAMNGCVAADINGDKRLDVVCTGAGAVTRWYENLGRTPASAGR
jgi:hypothetical protein